MARHLKICVQGFWRNHVCISQDKNIYVEDWGEGLVGKSCPVLCVADLNKGAVILYAGVPPHISPGQVSQMYITILICLMDNQLCYAIHGKCYISNLKFNCCNVNWIIKYSLFFLKALWAPNGRGVVFVGQWNEPFRLGLKFCSNRRWGVELNIASTA